MPFILKRYIFNIIVRRYFNFARLLFKSKSKISKNSNFPELLKSSGVLGNVKFDTLKFFSEWQIAEKKWNQGDYFDAVRRRKNILEDLYDVQEITDSSYFPPFLSQNFGVAFGHVGMMAAHLEGTKTGILPRGLRCIPIAKEYASREITKSVLREYREVPTENCANILELPPTWHISERLEMFKGIDGFIDLYAVLEAIYSNRKVNRLNPILSLDVNYQERARHTLKKNGMPDDSWFVSLHIRNSGPPGLRRNQPIETFLPAINYIIAQGGKVIRIGDSTMESFGEIEGLIDLSRSPSDYWLHSYVLAHGKFHIGTTSGPDCIPSLFGVPSLLTNTIAIGRNMYTLSEKSRFIPKHIVSNSKKWSLREILASPEAYAEKEIDYNRSGYYLEPNSEIDILRATQEIYRSVFQNGSIDDFSHMREVNSIRKEMRAIGYGFIAQSFIEEHGSSFLG